MRVVADDVEIVADFAGELSNGYATFLAVWLIGLEVFATERPCVGIVALDYRVEHSDIIAAVAGFSGKGTVYHIGTYFNRRHSGKASLGKCFPSEEGKHCHSEDCKNLLHGLVDY